MTPSGGLRSVCVSSSPPVTTLTGRLAPVCSALAPRLSPALPVGLRTASRAAVVLPNCAVRLRGGTFDRALTIGSAPQTR